MSAFLFILFAFSLVSFSFSMAKFHPPLGEFSPFAGTVFKKLLISPSFAFLANSRFASFDKKLVIDLTARKSFCLSSRKIFLSWILPINVVANIEIPKTTTTIKVATIHVIASDACAFLPKNILFDIFLVLIYGYIHLRNNSFAFAVKGIKRFRIKKHIS